MRRMRGFWWKGFQTGGCAASYRFVPRERSTGALDAFEAGFDDDPEAPAAGSSRPAVAVQVGGPRGRGTARLIEQSSDTIGPGPDPGPALPEAKFIHVVRDGRDASASRVAQTRGLIRPRTRRQGLEWWEERIRRINAGEEAIAPDRLLTISLDELLLVPTRPALRPLCQFLDVYLQQRMRAYFQREMSAERANTERWRHGSSPAAPSRSSGLRGGRGGARGRSRAVRAARAPYARAVQEPGRRGAGAAPVRDRRRASAGSVGEAGGRRGFGAP